MTRFTQHRAVVLLPALLLASVAAQAQAQGVPNRLSFSGNLTNSGAPTNGPQNFVFTLYDAPTGGANVWTETQNGLAVNNGLVHATLGSSTALTPAILNGAALYLEVSVNGTVLAPRAAILSAPYAVRAGVANGAESLGGILPGDVVTSVTGSSGVTATRSGNTYALGVNPALIQARVTGTCGPNASIASIAPNGTVACETDDSASYTGSAPIAVAGSAVSLTTCGANQVYKMVGGAWTCSSDSDTPPTANPPLSVSGNTISLTTCGSNQIYKMVGGVWTCAFDNDTVYAGVPPVTVSGSSIGLTNCGANQAYRMNGSGTAWVCAPSASVVNVSTTAQFSVTTTSITWLYGANNVPVANGENVLLWVNYDFVIASTTGGVACGLPPQCSSSSGWTRPCYRPTGSATLTVGPYHYFNDPTPNSANRRSGQIVTGFFPGISPGNYDFGVCGNKNLASTSIADFIVDNPNVIVQKF